MTHKTNMKRLIFRIIGLSLIVFLSSYVLSGQKSVIEGKVTTFESIPIINATIIAKSNKVVVLSDTLGIFTITCAPADKLTVTARGFARRRVRIKENTKYVLVNLKLLT